MKIEFRKLYYSQLNKFQMEDFAGASGRFR